MAAPAMKLTQPLPQGQASLGGTEPFCLIPGVKASTWVAHRADVCGPELNHLHFKARPFPSEASLPHPLLPMLAVIRSTPRILP